MKTHNNTGKAYAFFNCSASKSQIESELDDIRDIARIPGQLELTLTEGVENLDCHNDAKLKKVVEGAKDSGMRYVFAASYPSAGNRETADELSSVLNQAYQSPLYKDGEQFEGGIVFEESGEYQFRN